MEIVTTMVRFRCPKTSMKKTTDNAQLFAFIGDTPDKPITIWVPKKKLLVKEESKSSTYNECVMPKWAFMKSTLPYFVELLEEFKHTEVINDTDKV